MNQGGQNPPVLVSETMAHKLAISTLTIKARHFSGMRFDTEDQAGRKLAASAALTRKFYWFDVTANVPDMASPLLGYFAVNKTTGDVWDSGSCRRLHSVFIWHFQKQLIEKKEISHNEFSKLSTKAPCEP